MFRNCLHRCKKVLWAVSVQSVLYGCETWSFTFREEHRLRVFENWVLRRIFGPKRDDVTGEWRRLHNEELQVASIFFFTSYQGLFG